MTAIRTITDLLERLGDIPPNRIRLQPFPGTATEQDVVAVKDRENRACELIDGVLVEKATGVRESLLAGLLLSLPRGFVDPRNLGLVTGPDGALKLFPDLVRIPDVAFLAWESIPGSRVPEEPIPQIVPTLAVEVLSKGNTPKEMARKRREFFDAGVRLVWMVDLVARTVAVFSSPDQTRTLDVSQTLDGSDVLLGFVLPLGGRQVKTCPTKSHDRVVRLRKTRSCRAGFNLPSALRDLFAELDRQGPQ